MYKPPFHLTEEHLALLSKITLLAPELPESHMLLTESEVKQEHARLGGDGCYRRGGDTPHWVPVLMPHLLCWLNESPTHPVIRAVVFCRELLRISPFSSGNEILAGRLFKHLLSCCHPALASLETNFALAAINETELISASLHAILAALHPKAPSPRTCPRRLSPADQIQAYIRRHPGSKRQDLMTALPDISPRMLDRHLQTLRESGRIEYRGSRKTGAYFTL